LLRRFCYRRNGSSSNFGVCGYPDVWSVLRIRCAGLYAIWTRDDDHSYPEWSFALLAKDVADIGPVAESTDGGTEIREAGGLVLHAARARWPEVSDGGESSINEGRVEIEEAYLRWRKWNYWQGMVQRTCATPPASKLRLNSAPNSWIHLLGPAKQRVRLACRANGFSNLIVNRQRRSLSMCWKHGSCRSPTWGILQATPRASWTQNTKTYRRTSRGIDHF